MSLDRTTLAENVVSHIKSLVDPMQLQMSDTVGKASEKKKAKKAHQSKYMAKVEM